MKRFILTFGLFAALACSGGDSGSQTGAVAPGDAASVDAAGDWADEAEAGGADTSECLELVADGRYAEALTPCTMAAQNSPDNPEIADALAQAEANAAGTAAAEIDADADALGDAIDDAAEAADEAAPTQIDDTTNGSTDPM